MSAGSSARPATGAVIARRQWWLGGLAAVSSGLSYLNALNNPFVYDDIRMVLQNPSIQDVTAVRSIVFREVTRPLVNFSYAIDRAIWGVEPVGFHLTSVLLHTLNVWLLFTLMWRLADDRLNRTGGGAAPVRVTAAAFAAAAAFGLHPMMTQAVGYVSGRPEVLCGTFFLLALLTGRRWLFEGATRWLALTLGLWVAAMASKEVAALWPIVFLLYDQLFGPTEPEAARRRLWRLHVPLVAATLVAGAARVAVLVWVENPLEAAFHPEFLLLEALATWKYAQLLVAPINQSVFHQMAAPAGGWSGPLVAAAAALGIWAVAVWLVRRREPLLTLGTYWFLLLLMPAAILVALNLGEPMAEHRVYLASAGLFMMFGSGVGWLWEQLDDRTRVRRVGLRLALAGTLTVLGGLTVHRNVLWSNPEWLWADAVERSPRVWVPRVMLGEALQAAGKHDQAAGEYRFAIRLSPDQPLAYMKLGVCLAEMGDLAGAERTFRELKRRWPDSVVASNGLGAVAMMDGRPDEAREHFTEALALAPGDITARQSLALLYETIADNPAEALRLCEEVRELAPDTPGVAECIRRNRERLVGEYN